eukprot:COSAG02_NODE_7_length_64539_cov_120.393482_29_plen_225_part_00
MRALALLVLLLSIGAHSAAARKTTARRAKEEAKRLGLAVREHGMAGRYPESIAASLQAIALDPTSYSLYSDLSYTLTQVVKQPQHEQQQLKQRLADAAGGVDEQMPFVPALAALYSPISASFQVRAIQVAKLGAEAGCTAIARSAGFDRSTNRTWMGLALDALSQEAVPTPPIAHVKNCASALARIASSADELDPIASFVAGRMTLAIEHKYGHTPGFPELFNW